jgi:hypothetical protein
VPRVATAIPHVSEPLAWQRLYVLLGNGDIRRTLSISADAMEAVGLSGYHMTTVKALRSWAQAAVPPAAALCLRILREEQRTDGGWSRRFAIGAAETGVALRYLHLALAAGETTLTDDHCARALNWLPVVVRDDGILPFPESDDVDLARPGYFAYLLWRYELDVPELRSKMDPFLPDALVARYSWVAQWPAPAEQLQANEIDDLDQLLMGLVGAAGLAPASKTMKNVALHLVARGLPDRFAELEGNQAQKIRTLFYYTWSLDAVATVNSTLTNAERDQIRAFIAQAQFALCGQVEHRRPGDANTLSYALRALLFQPVTEARAIQVRSDVARQLIDTQTEELSSAADRYAGTLQLGLGVLAYAQSGGSEEWLWALNPSPPETIVGSSGLSEAAFAAVPHRLTMRILDYSRRGRWLENFVGALIGLFIGLEFLDLPELRSAISGHPLVVFWLIAAGNIVWLTVRQAGRRRDAAAGPVVSAVVGFSILSLAGSVPVPAGLLGAGLLLASLGNLRLFRAPAEARRWLERLPAWAVTVMIPLAVSQLAGFDGSEVLVGAVAAVVIGLLVPVLVTARRRRIGVARVGLQVISLIVAWAIASFLIAVAAQRHYLENLDRVMLLATRTDRGHGKSGDRPERLGPAHRTLKRGRSLVCYG